MHSPKNVARIIFTLMALITLSHQQPPPASGNMNMGTSATIGTVCGKTKADSTVAFTNVSDTAAGTATGYPGGYRRMVSNNCPGYDYSSQSTGNAVYSSNKDVKFPMTPQLSGTNIYVGIKGANGVTNSNAVKGPIGFAVNGIAIYGNADASNMDAHINESKTFDTCLGHSDPSGTYHYHEEPTAGCVYTDTAGAHSPLFGFLADGIPLYGTLGDAGVAPTDLDECGGHTDKAYPYYHYHLPKGRTFPYTVSCLKGCIYSNINNPSLSSYVKTISTCKATTQQDYSTLTIGASATVAPVVSTSANFIKGLFGIFLSIILLFV